MILPVIIAGGIGSRLWPLSQIHRPKQFLSLLESGDESFSSVTNNDEIRNKLTMLQMTIERLNGLQTLPPIIICNEKHRFIVAEQVRQLGIKPSAIILEPEGRGTAPAVALASIYVKNNFDQRQNKPILLVLPADHAINNLSAFHQSIKQANDYAKENHIATFGIVTKSAETRYGYIERGQKAKQGKGYKINAFVEKPLLKKAKEYVDSGQYFWNSGMFMFTSECYLHQLENLQPKIFLACTNAMKSINSDEDFIRLNKQEFLESPNISIDYAIMEHLCHSKHKVDEAFVIPLDADWSDLGNFKALWEYSEKDQNQNHIRGNVKTVKTNNCLVFSKDKLVTTVGVDNLVIVDTENALLVANLNTLDEIGLVVKKLEK